MKQLIRILPVAILVLLASCSKKTTEVVTPIDPSILNANVVERLNVARNSAEQITGRINLELASGKQKAEIGGSIKMKRNDVIQISLQVFGFVEAGRLELTRDYFLILNRIGKQYVKASYKDIKFFKENGIDFSTLQALFWNELFLTGEKKNNVPVATDYEQKQEGDNITLTQVTENLVTTFLTSTTPCTLRQSTVKANTGGTVRCSYNRWARLGKQDFPDKMQFDINIDNVPVNIEMELTRLRTNEKWTDTRTTIDRMKLKQVSIQQVFNQILSLSN